MEGIILAGGMGTRLRPLTKFVNKNLLPILNHPTLYYPLTTLVKSGCTELFVVTNGPNSYQIANYCSKLNIPDVKITCIVQRTGWIAEAIVLSRRLIKNYPFILASGDNITSHNFRQDIKEYRSGGIVFLKEVPDPRHFGVAVLSKDNDLVTLEEKPRKPKSNLALTDYYLFDEKIFRYVENVEKLGRGEMVLTSILNHYLRDGCLKWKQILEFWIDTGSFDRLARANAHLFFENISYLTRSDAIWKMFWQKPDMLS